MNIEESTELADYYESPAGRADVRQALDREPNAADAAAGNAVRLILAASADEYGLPLRLLGPMPSWFYPAVGRVVAVCSLLEYRAQILVEALSLAPADSFSSTSFSDLRKSARKAAILVDERQIGSTIGEVRGDVDRFMAQVQEVLQRRHGVVHAMWPAQVGDEQLGWRPRRPGKDVETRITQDNTLADMKQLISAASALINQAEALHGAVNAAAVRALQAGVALPDLHKAAGVKPPPTEG